MEPAESAVDTEKCCKVMFKQPVTCPWSNFQPYPSSMSKNRAGELSTSQTPTTDKQTYLEPKPTPKTCPSLQQSSSQFFYFLRLMQLFPETHPATLHTVLSLCKNDFFCAVDKLLYARRCKTLYNRSHSLCRRYTYNGGHPCCSFNDPCKNMRRERVVDPQVPQERSRVAEPIATSILYSRSEANKEALLDLTMKNEYNLDEYGESEISKTPGPINILKKENEHQTQTTASSETCETVGTVCEALYEK